MLNASNKLRKVVFTPFKKGFGPSFTLTTWDTGRSDSMGKSRIGYRLESRNHYNSINGRVLKKWHAEKPVVIFEGEDFCCSPLHCIDSDECIVALMVFLTLRPGGTDSKYFDNYTPGQLEFCNNYAESLSCEVACRFGE